MWCTAIVNTTLHKRGCEFTFWKRGLLAICECLQGNENCNTVWGGHRVFLRGKKVSFKDKGEEVQNSTVSCASGSTDNWICMALAYSVEVEWQKHQNLVIISNKTRKIFFFLEKGNVVKDSRLNSLKTGLAILNLRCRRLTGECSRNCCKAMRKQDWAKGKLTIVWLQQGSHRASTQVFRVVQFDTRRPDIYTLSSTGYWM